MTAHIGFRSSSTTQLSSRNGSYTRGIEPAWLSRLLTRKSRNSQYLSVQDLETDALFRAEDSTISPTASLLGPDAASSPEKIKPGTHTTLSPPPSAPLEIPGARSGKSTSTRRRFSFTPRSTRDTDTPSEIPQMQTQIPRSTSGAVYVPRHAASDFRQVAVPTTYRDSLVFMYSSSSGSSDNQQKQKHRRRSKADRSSASAMAEFQRRRKRASAAPKLESKSDTSPAKTSVNKGKDDESAVVGTETNSAKPSTVAEEDCEALIFPCEENGDNNTTNKKARKSSNNALAVPELILPKERKKTRSVPPRPHSTLGHDLSLQVPQLAVAGALASSASSISSRRARRGSFAKNRRASRRQSSILAMPINNNEAPGQQEKTKGKRGSVMVNLGRRVSEYIKPTTMPNNEAMVLPQIALNQRSA